MAEAVQGLADTYAMFGRLPDAARDELGVDLALIGRDYLALQQVRAPKDTGALEGALGLQLLLDQLRVRVGLVGKFSRPNFYGRIIEFGRQAQTVLVQRRRRVNGMLRVGGTRKRVEDIVATYALHVKASAAAPFINVPDADLDRVTAQRLAEFWSGTLDRAGA